MRKVVPWVALAIGLVVSLAVAYGAYVLADYSWDQVVSYESPYLEGGEQAEHDARLGTPQARRLVLVIVDGLRLDASMDMKSLQGMRARGSDLVAVTPQPSLSFPVWTTILSGAPNVISGVTTNWYDRKVIVETLIDLEIEAGRRTVIVGPPDFQTLYRTEGANRVDAQPWKGKPLADYMSHRAIALAKVEDAEFVLVHIPDIDEAGHEHGATSVEYRAAVERVDEALGRLITSLAATDTAFAVVSDYGHIAPGGHGGWEREVTQVPAVFGGAGVAMGVDGFIAQEDIAPTLAAIHGLRSPLDSVGTFRTDVSPHVGQDWRSQKSDIAYRIAAYVSPHLYGGLTGRRGKPGPYRTVDVGSVLESAEDVPDPLRAADLASEVLAQQRRGRLPLALGLGAAALAAFAFIGAMSWRALVSALLGAATYFGFYNTLYFVLHGHRWSLSAFNSEDLIQSFFNVRMAEAVLAALVGASVAAVVYPLLRWEPKGPRGPYLAGWLSLGVATVLVTQALIGLQVAWFLWAYGAEVTWVLPDLRWGFKYDLDLVQATALGAAAILAPVVTYLAGRYHPRVRTPRPAHDERTAA